jgi:long-chain acyl-CoA synthetase
MRYWPEYVPKKLKYPDITLYESLQLSAAKYPERCAIDFYGKKIGYSELKIMADGFASMLSKRGIGKGSRVAMCMHNCPQFVFSLYGTSKAGAIAVPINPLLKKDELSNILNDCKPELVLTENDVPWRSVKVNADSFIDETEDEVLKEIKNRYGSDNVRSDPALIMYSSGTSGRPKGAMLTHRNVIANALSGSVWSKKNETDVSLAALPFSHVLGLVESLCGSVLSGSEMVILKRFDTHEALKAIEREKCTILTGVPQMIRALIRDAPSYDLSSLRICFVGGAPMGEEDLQGFIKMTGCELLEGYGMTESAAQLTINPADRRKPGSVGIPIPDVSLKVIDDNGMELGTNEIGELIFKGPQIMKGYWNDEERTRRTIVNGWLHTGDIGYFDDEGYVYIKGRKDRQIKVSGYAVLPQEIEKVLMKNPKIAQAKVIASEDRKKGHAIKALVVLREEASAREIMDWCRNKLADYKCPEEIEFVSAITDEDKGEVQK